MAQQAVQQPTTNIRTETKMFRGGMNKDLDYSIQSNNTYLHAENLRLVADKDSTSGALENILGNKGFITSGIETGQMICGHGLVRDTLILFTTNQHYKNPVSADTQENHIYKVLFEAEDQLASIDKIFDDTGKDIKLNFSIANPIKAIGRYETSVIQKIYWVDGYNKIRYANIAVTISAYTVDQFEFIPLATLPKPVLNDIVSGSIKPGVVMYAYQLYMLNGAETVFSPISNTIHITNEDDFLSNSEYYKGSEVDDPGSKGIKLSINNSANSDFTRMRVVAIHYSYLNSTPSVRVAGEFAIDSVGATIYFTDTGETFGSYTPEEFAIIDTSLFTATDLETKDNILFASDITEEYFDIGDWDSRAYRFDDSVQPEAKIYDADGGLEHTIVNDGIPNWPTMTGAEKIYDAINKHNDLDNDTTPGTYEFIYQKDGSTPGAEGPNVVVAFDTTSIILDSKLDAYYLGADQNEPTSYWNFASPWLAGGNRSFQRDETYRLAIRFFDDKGRSSFANWICDLRIPKIESGGSERMIWIVGVSELTKIIFPKIQISSFPTGAKAYQILFVPRDSINDRTVVCQGVLLSAKNADTDYPDSVSIIPATGDDLIRFVSPEVNFNKDFAKRSGDFLQNVHYSFSNHDIIGSTTSDICTLKWKETSVPIKTFPIAATDKDVIVDMEIVSPSTTMHTIGTHNYVNHSPETPVYYGGTALVIAPTAPATWTGMGGTNYQNKIVNYKRNLFGSQYDGYTYETRALNIYIPCSDTKSSLDSDVNTSGDTFICYFDYLSLVWDKEEELNQSPSESNSERVYVPLETSINCTLRHDDCPHRVYAIASYGALIQETAGIHQDPGENTYVQETDLYQYNSVYSQLGKVTPVVPKPADFKFTAYSDVKVMASDVKINGEESDSWTKFKVNNYIEVDSKYGSITNLLNWKNRLMFWQPKAFGVLAVNDRTLITEADVASLVLGTGDILSRFDYLSTNSGSSHKFGVIGTDKGVYWVDGKQKQIYNFRALDVWDRRRQYVPLSPIKGIQSYLNSLNYISDVRLVNDRKYNEIVFTLAPGQKGTVTQLAGSDPYKYRIAVDGEIPAAIAANDHMFVSGINYKVQAIDLENDTVDFWTKNTDQFDSTDRVIVAFDANRITISFNEILDVFASFYSFTPKWYISHYNNFLTIDSTKDLNKLYLHGGNMTTTTDAISRCHFYGAYKDSKLKLIFNDSYPNTKVFDNLMFITDSTDSLLPGKNFYTDTFKSIQCWNDYQHSGTATTLTAGTNVERKERTWTMAVPRNAVDIDVSSNPDIFSAASWDSTQLFKERMRDKFLIIEFIYENTGKGDYGYKFSIPMIGLKYRNSIR